MAAGGKADAAAKTPEVLKRITLRDPHLRLTQVVLQDQTDRHNELVQLREWLLHPAERLELQGNLFVLENVLTGEGRILLKLAPLPHARPIRTAADLRVVPRRGTGYDLMVLGGSGADDFVDLPFTGGMIGRTRALQQFQRSRMPNTPEHRIPRFLSNTWGDWSRDTRIRQEFMEKEIDAGARLGVEVVQIDDGWQKGITANSAKAVGKGATRGFRRIQADFWDPDPVKFPGGLQPLVRRAKDHGMELGLWFYPDFEDDFANWKKEVASLLEFHRKLGISYFKMDGIYAPTTKSQRNLNNLFAAVLRDTGGKVVFDLDVTASLRPGYFGMLGTGPLFVENRYTDRHRYWPHQTLRNLWQLAWWVDPIRLRMELLNNARNANKYPDDPLAPVHYAPDTLFATVFFSNPLGWFEVSNLPAAYFQRVAPLVSVWKSLRSELFAGTIVPLGQVPDGVAWTGFASVADGGKAALALVFRELNPSHSWRMALPGFSGRSGARCEVLAGRSAAQWTGESLQITGVESLGYALIRVTT